MALKTTLAGANTARKVAMVAGTFSVAMGIGFFMQQQNAQAALTPTSITAASSTDVIPKAIASVPANDAGTSVPGTADDAKPLAIAQGSLVAPFANSPDPMAEPQIVTASVVPETVIDAAPSIAQPANLPVVAPEADPAAGAAIALDPKADSSMELAALDDKACEPTMDASVMGAALVELSIFADCNAGSAFTVHHEGMMFSGQTDSEGRATIIAPALSETAIFISAFDAGVGAFVETEVPDVDQYDRVVLQWRGTGAFEIHAMEFGATYGDVGHVWWDAPRNYTSAVSGDGGFLLSLGDGRIDKGRFAQVYTLPREVTGQSGTVALSVEAEVTAANCATEIEAQTLERMPGDGIRIVDLMLQVPDCDAIGDFLVLKNVLSDLTL